MRYIFTTLILLISCQINILGSEILTPDVVIKIINDSPFAYNLEFKEDTINYDHSGKLNSNIYFIEEVDGKPTINVIDFSDIDKDMYKKAEDYFQNKDNEKARELYLEMLKLNPKLFPYYTYIGQTFEREKNYDEAIKWLKIAIEKNKIDYMAHWFLADNMVEKGNFTDALNSIITAHLLNRNNPRILLSLKKILKLNNLNYDDWCFNPQYKIDSISAKEYSIQLMNLNWLSYASAKAVRRFEPDYNGTKSPLNLDLIQLEMEAMLGLSIALKQEVESKDNPIPLEISKLYQAEKDNKFKEYVIYESILPNYPKAIYFLSDDTIENLIDYFLKFKTKKIN